MKRNYLFGLVIISIFTLLFTSFLYADGVMISNGYTKESEQEGIIIHEKGKETLFLRVQFHGEPKDFAWIIPTPSKPEVDKAPEEIFESLHELLAPYPIFSKIGMGMSMMASSIDGVNIIESKEVGIYNVTVLSADTPNALSNWLREEEFPVPDGAEDIFSDYVNKKWFFVAIKINAQKLTKEEKNKIEEGSTPPLKFTFNSEQIVYPLKISSIASTNFKFPYIDKETETALLSALKKNVKEFAYEFDKESSSGEKLVDDIHSHTHNDTLLKVAFSNFCLSRF